MKNIKLILVVIIAFVLSILTVNASIYFFESEEVKYDNTLSKLTASNVQDAIDELYGENVYTVQFNGNGATSGTMEQIKCALGKNCMLPANNYVKQGYGFLGWSHTSDGPVSYENQKSIVLINPSNNIVTLYAKWADNVGTLKVKNYTSNIDPLSSDINTEFTFKLKVLNNPSDITDMSYTLKDLPYDYKLDYEPLAFTIIFLNSVNGKLIDDIDEGIGVYVSKCKGTLEECMETFEALDTSDSSSWNTMNNYKAVCKYGTANINRVNNIVCEYYNEKGITSQYVDYSVNYYYFKSTNAFLSDPSQYGSNRELKYTLLNDTILYSITDFYKSGNTAIFYMKRNEKKVDTTLLDEYIFTLEGLEEMDFILPTGLEYEISVETPEGWTKLEQSNQTGIISFNTVNESVFVHTK